MVSPCALKILLSIPFQQLYTDVATGEIQADLSDDVTKLEELIKELQDLSAQLRNQWESLVKLRPPPSLEAADMSR